MQNIDQAFSTHGHNLYEFFNRPGVGFYIPLYQREYSWDNDNINQLLEDITRGIEKLCDDEPSELRFLGTIITVKENDHSKIEPIDRAGLPSTIEKIIDGQQRISTAALFSSILHMNFWNFKQKYLNNAEIKDDVIEICDNWMDKLLHIVSFNLGRGTPPNKPKIIRGSLDKWTKTGERDTCYMSHLGNYLSWYIGEIVRAEGASSTSDKKINLAGILTREFKQHPVGKNSWDIKNWVSSLQDSDKARENNDFPDAEEVLSKLDENFLWSYSREEFINKCSEDKSSTLFADFLYLLRLCVTSHYLLERCIVTHILPINDEWAFDMFQSLNASGTPLTAIETFKPLVVNVAGVQEFKNSSWSKTFDNVDDMFKGTRGAASKNKITNDFLISFGITAKQKTVTSHFSQQMIWLKSTFNSLTSIDEKKEYIKYFGNYSEFYNKFWLRYNGSNDELFDKIDSHSEKDLVSTLMLFLKESNHKMANTILGRFFDDVLRGNTNSVENYGKAVKIISAFYSLWRGAYSNSGLDGTYREFFKGNNGDNNFWKMNESLSIDALKTYLQNVLIQKEIDTKVKWKEKAMNSLRYDKAKSVCNLLLYIASDNTISDPDIDGLMKVGSTGVSNYLNVKHWRNSDLATLEHIAPQNPEAGSGWDNDIYNEPEALFHAVGNLTLLPIDLNSSLGNKNWAEKLLYYKFLGSSDPARQQELRNRAQSDGINLNTEILDKLTNSNYHHHIQPLSSLQNSFDWDSAFIRTRSERIIDLGYDKLMSWLNC